MNISPIISSNAAAAFAVGNIALFTGVDLLLGRVKFAENTPQNKIYTSLAVGVSFLAANLGLSLLTQANLSGVALTAIAISAIAIRALWLLCRTESKVASPSLPIQETTPISPIQEDKPLVKKDFKVIFAFDNEDDAPIITNLKNVSGMPKEYEVVKKQVLSDRTEEFKREGCIICNVILPSARLDDMVDDNLGDLINIFGRNKVLLIVITRKYEMGGESICASLLKNINYQDKNGNLKNCLVFWDDKKINLRANAKVPQEIENPEKHLAKLNSVIKNLSEI